MLKLGKQCLKQFYIIATTQNMGKCSNGVIHLVRKMATMDQDSLTFELNLLFLSLCYGHTFMVKVSKSCREQLLTHGNAAVSPID